MNINVALVTVMMISTFILSLVLNLTGQQKPNENQELQDGAVQQIAVDTGMATAKGREADLGEPCNNSTLQDMVLAALRKVTLEGNGSISEGANTQILPLQITCGAGNHQQQAMELKNELKVGLFVVSLSTTAIISFLGAFTGSQTSGRSKHLLRAGMLLMVGSFCSAVMLLLLLAFRASSVLLVKTSLWICTGSMVMSLLLLSVFYFQST